MSTTDTIWKWALVICVAMAVVSRSHAAGPDLEPFFGEFEGEAITDQEGELNTRDLRVTISPARDGFTVEWISVTKRSDGSLKRKEYSIDFLPTRRQGIFRSGQRKDLFGHAVPLDPMQGDPYVWARVHEDTMTVFALHVLEDGGYEMQTYARRRIPEGLSLSYSRVRDGEVLRTVTGILREVK